MSGVKRVLVSPDDPTEELTTAKKPRYTQKPLLKVQCSEFISSCITGLIQVFFPADIIMEAWDNINVGIQITNIAFSVHSSLRMRAKTSDGVAPNLETKLRTTMPSVTFKGVVYSKEYALLAKVVKSCATLHNLSYSLSDITEGNVCLTEWAGIAGPIFNFLTGFGLRLKELRLGHAEFPMKKSPTEIRSRSVAHYGLSKAHHVLLEGIRFPPETRASMVMTVGVLTALLNYLEAPEGYFKKYYDACLRGLAHIPDIDQILKAIRGKPRAQIKGIIELLADITLIITPRSAHRAFPCPNIFMNVMFNKSKVAEYRAMMGPLIVESRGLAEGSDVAVLIPAMATNDFKLPPNAIPLSEIKKNINFSGPSSAYFYNLGKYLRLTFSPSFSGVEAGQMLFHCHWGTYQEDFGILRQITSCGSWVKRDFLGDKFKNMNQGANLSAAEFIELKHFSKLNSASMTGLLAQGSKQLAANPVFSGKRERLFSEDFMAFMNQKGGTSVYTMDLAGIEANLSKILRGLLKDIQANGGKQKCGQASWFNVNGNNMVGRLDDTTTIASDPNFSVVETGEYFLG